VTSPDRWQHVERLYHDALARDEGERAAFLRDACGADETLRREVESLLAYAGDAQLFMAAPAIDVVAAAIQSAEMTRPFIGQRLGPYEMVSLLGSGGMGEVYRARDTKLGRDVAIKILPEAFTADADRRARFEREARLLAALNHPHIGAIYGFEDREGIHALVLELVEGQTLADRSSAGPLPVPEALTIARQIAEALEAAHERGIVHRDLKPANVILQGARGLPSTPRKTAPIPTRAALPHGSQVPGSSPDSPPPVTDEVRVKVVDFGLAKVGSSESVHDLTHSPTITIGGTSEGVILGTAAYMSPEQARGKAVDKRTDIWAFGCVVYEILTGRKAFAGETVSDTIAAILEREPDWSALPDTTPSTIRRLLQRSLEKDPKRRLHDIADARIEIDDVAREPVASAREAGSFDGGPGVLVTARRVWALAAAAVALVVLGAAAGVLWWPVRVTSRPSSLTRLMITLPAAQALEKGRFPPVALSPDGKLLVYAAAVDGGRTNLYLRPLDELAARPIPATEGASTPFFSPDGRWLAFYANGLLEKVSVAGGVPLTICEAPPVWSATWGENDSIVFATTVAASGLWRVSANGGEPVQITTPKPDEAQHGYPQILPGGTQVLFSVRRKNAWHLALLTLKSGDWRLLGNGRVIGEGAQYLPTGHLVYAQSGGLVATPFDPSNGNLDQPPVPLLERIETSRFGGAYFAFAAGAGTLVYVPAATTVADRTLLRVDRDGRAAPLVEAHGAYEYPVFSPDGRQVAVMIASEAGSDIWIIDLERATRIRFTAGGTSAFPVWAPDGSRVAFQSTAPGPWNLFWKPLDGRTDAQPLLRAADSSLARSVPSTGESLLPGTLPTLSGAGPQFPMSWSPDGSTVAFHERKPNGERDIWVVSPGSDPVPFLLTPFDERSPRFSPDGKWLAYVSDESGRNDVYVQPFPGPGPKWLVSTDGGIDPVWSRDGRELFYRKDDEVMAVSVAPKGEFSAGRPQRLFEIRFDAGDNGPNYDVSRDGKWFVMPRAAQGRTPGELHLVLNWFGEVTARTQAANARHSRNAPQELAALWKGAQ
jgi:eukaryotic-like serine/threonine-protein kinase